MITFQQAIDAKNLLQPITIFQNKPVKAEIEGTYIDVRIDKATVPSGYYTYDMVEDDNGEKCAIRPHAWVNHAGTIITQTPITFPKIDQNHMYEQLNLLNFEETNQDIADADFTF